MLSEEQIERVLRRFAELEAELASAGDDADKVVRLSKEYADLTPVANAAQDLKSARAEQLDLQQMLEDPDTEAEMKELAEAELAEIDEKLPAMDRDLQILLLPRDAADEKSAIMEIRAGTGGDEAGLFAGDLLRMYQRYAESQGWRFELMSASGTDLGGYKEAVANISGKGVFARLKYESGVHRVQRVPETESGGRIHTSAATVAVLPEAEDVDIDIQDKDLQIDTYRAQGAGGQHVNTTDSAVRITHIPTGAVAYSSEEKSQHKNKAKAMRLLVAKIADAERRKKELEIASTRAGQVGSGDRSERIRTYNFPQNRLTDHRINLTRYNLDHVMDGDLEEVVSSLVAFFHQKQLQGSE